MGTLVDTGTPAVNGGTNVPIPGFVIWAVTGGAVVGSVTLISVKTGLTIVASRTVNTLAPTKGGDACVVCACEEDCDDAEAPLFVDLVTVSKVLPLLKCMHKMRNFPRKEIKKNSC